MNPRGFALLAVLWIVAVLGAVVGTSARFLRTEQRAVANRLAMTRGRWAAEACLAIAEARWQASAVTRRPVSLGRNVYCDWRIDDPAERVNINTADAEQLARLLVACGLPTGSAQAVAARVVTRRGQVRFDDSVEIAALDGVPASALRFLDVSGGNAVSVLGPREVLLSLPGFNDEAIAVLAARIAARRPVAGLAELLDAVSPVTRAQLEARRAELAERLAFTPAVLRLRSEGWVGSRGPRAQLDLLVAPEPDRLGVLVRQVR